MAGDTCENYTNHKKLEEIGKEWNIEQKQKTKFIFAWESKAENFIS